MPISCTLTLFWTTLSALPQLADTAIDMDPEPAYILDIGCIESEDSAVDEVSGKPKRRWLGVRFDCCSVYHRIYKNRSGTHYLGRCPKCCREVSVRVGPDGTPERFFRAW